MNYRPVSLTSEICKTMEHILTSQIMHHLELNDILAEAQHGFRSKHSCEAQLFLTTNDLARAIDDKIQTDMAILDFSKAFDKVAHVRLKHKLDFYGIRGKLLKWLEAFLSDRSQQIVIGGTFSSSSVVTSEVPQGSVLGPTLFLIYINDIITDIHSKIRLFADDCLVYHSINSYNDHQILQRDLNTLTAWSLKDGKWNLMSVSVRYSRCLCDTHKVIFHFPYNMQNVPLEIVVQHNYLGVCIHQKLSWHSHIEILCNKANRLLGFLQRNLYHCPSYLRELAYRQLILPILDYCSPIWDPHQSGLIHKLEMVQHRAARFVLNQPWNRHHPDSISQMLHELKWPSLQDRRKQARLVLLFKIMNDLICIPPQYLPIKFPLSSTRAHHPLKLQQPCARTDVYRCSFLPRTIPDWNRLPINNIKELNLTSFKNCLLNDIK
ncbi:MAG: reverse transcriptase family protein [Acidobacteria bacterium]|nr:reverse transcriptase family protein [Acidobacteriota bacterium]